MNPYNIDWVTVSGTPGLLYLTPEKGPYRHGYRLQGRGQKGDLLVLGGLGPGIEQVWVCFDVSNGNPELLMGRVYVWVFGTKEEAWEKYNLHASEKDFTDLMRPQRYAILRGKPRVEKGPG